MNSLSFKIEDKIVAELLGVQNFTSEETAILEIVKNAYDAGATQLELKISIDSIEIIDNGIGMSENDIHDYWMHIGKSNKSYEFTDLNQDIRISAGSKGIGRFALARLGQNIKLYSKRKEFKAIKWQTDWIHTFVDEIDDSEINSCGTRIIIQGLHSSWGKRKVSNLIAFLSRVYNDNKMSIRIVSDDFDELIEPLFPQPQIGVNCKSLIELSIISSVLIVDIHNDEFHDNIQSFILDSNIHYHRIEIPLKDLLVNWANDIIEDPSSESIANLLKNLGDFDARFFFNFKANSADIEKYGYKYKETPIMLKKGVILYRNAFSLASYDGSKDWLNLNDRARKSPASASHETGSWRVRENQISGYVSIDKKKNNQLKDLSNRQGLEENIYYYLLLEIISLGLKEFERYRQNIIRQIKKYYHKSDTVPSTKKNKILHNVISRKQDIKKLSDSEIEELIGEIVTLKKSYSDLVESEKENSEKYRYDVRLLNMLSTIGMKAAASAHEINNSRTQFVMSYGLIETALREYGLWEQLESSEYTAISSKNIPMIIQQGQKSIDKFLILIDTILQKNEKSFFLPNNINLNLSLEKIMEKWQSDYSRISFKSKFDSDIVVKLSEDILWTIFDNLILNSIQQNNDDISININVWKEDEFIYFFYKDNGIGLSEKYKDRPLLILEPHETSRIDGHGLGMWIINNTILMAKGKIEEIVGDNGFGIKFYIKGM